MSKRNRLQMLYSPAMRYFMAVAENGSIRGAARELNVASSAINRQILNLEDQFGLHFFDRVGRGLKLSTAGEMLLEHAREAQAGLEATEEKLLDLSEMKSGHIRIATVESVADVYLPDMLSQFQRQYSGITVDITVTSSSGVEQMLLNAEAHVGFAFGPVTESSFRTEFTADLPIGVIVSLDHQLAKRKNLFLADCMEYPMITPNRKLGLGRRVAELLASQDTAPNQTITTNSLRLMRQMVREGDYIAFQTLLASETPSNQHLKHLTLNDKDLPVDKLNLLTNATHKLSLSPDAFRQFAVSYLKTHLMPE